MWNLIQKYITGQCTEEESERIQEWMNSSPANRRLFDELQQIWDLAPPENFHVDAEKALGRNKSIRHRTGKSPEDFFNEHSEKRFGTKTGNSQDLSRFPRVQKRKQSAGNFLRVAAVLIVAVTVGWYAGIYFKNSDKSMNQQSVAMQEIATKKGEKTEITFSDGSRVILNSASTLRFPKIFRGKQREVFLNGEAYFDVVHNSTRPFLVETAQAQIKDLGTKFDVRSWSEDKKVEVTVREGEVLVSAKHPASMPQKVVLKRGEYTSIEPGTDSLIVREVDYRDHLLWLNGGLYFDDTPFSEVLKQIGRRFAVSFDVKDESLLNIPYTGRFVRASLSKVLSVLSASMSITCQREKRQIVIRKTRPETE